MAKMKMMMTGSTILSNPNLNTKLNQNHNTDNNSELKDASMVSTYKFLKDNDDRRIDPNGGKIFVVGEVQNNFTALLSLLEKIEDYERAANDKVVFIGNFVGGPDTKRIIEVLNAYRKQAPENVIILKSVTEYLFWRGTSKSVLSSVLPSYRTGVLKKAYYTNDHFYPIDATTLSIHRKWAGDLPFCYQTDKLFFSNSGVNPKYPLDGQTETSCLFSHEKFLKEQSDYGKMIVHSKYPISDIKNLVKITKNRIHLNPETTKKGFVFCSVFDATKGSFIETLSSSVFK